MRDERTSVHQRFGSTKEVDRRAWFDELVVWHVRADLNVPGPLLDKQAAALLLDKTRRRSSRLDWYAPPLDSLRFRFSD